MRIPRFLLFVFLGGLALPAAAEQRQVALGADGNLYRVLAGPAGEVLRDDGAWDAATPLLALEVTHPGGEISRMVVPGSEGGEVERSPTLVFEEVSGGLFILWESNLSYIHSQIKLIRYAGGEWSEPISLPGELVSLKTAPHLAVTRDLYFTRDAAGSPGLRSRTIYHVLWWEAAGGERVVYCPVVLVDGVYVGWSPLFVLSDLGFGEPAFGAAQATEDLLRSPTIQPGVGGKSVVAALADPASGRLVELEIEVVPGELGALAQEVSQTILESGSGARPEDLPALADRARAQLVDFGRRLRLHPGVVDYLAQGAISEIFAGPPSADLPALADRARAQLVDFGARMAAQGVTQDVTEGDLWLLEFPATAESAASPGAPQPPHSLHLRLAAARPVPATEPGPTTLYLSRKGGEAVVVWQVDQQLRYRESQGEGWSEVRSLDLDGDLDLERAHALLSERAANR